MDRAAAFLQDVRKKDEDARLVSTGDDLYLETRAEISGFEVVEDKPETPQNTLLEDAAAAPLPDIRVQSIQNMFIAHLAASLVCMALGLPVYYWPLCYSALVAIICVSCVAQTLLYIVMIYLRKTKPTAALGVYIAWVVASAGVLGFSFFFACFFRITFFVF